MTFFTQQSGGKPSRLHPIALTGPGRSQDGSLLMSAAITLLVISIFAAVTMSLTSSGQLQSMSSTLDLQAFYAAESGLRYAAMKYLNQENTGGLTNEDDISADDEKTAFLEDLDGRTFDLPGSRGSINFEVYGYWFVVKKNNGTYLLDMPGRRPENFELPVDGLLAFGDTLGAPDTTPYRGGSVDADGVFSFTDAGPTQEQLLFHEGKPVYYATTQNYASGSTSVIYLPLESRPALPRSGLLEIGNVLAAYNYYKADESYTPQRIIISYCFDPVTRQQPIISNIPGQIVIVRKTMTLRVVSRTGEGDYSHGVDYTITLGSSDPDKVVDLVFTDSMSNPLGSLISPPSNADSGPALGTEMMAETCTDPDTGDETIHEFYAIQMKNLLERSEGETNTYCQGSALFADTSQINEAWEKGGKLNYDIQMKLATIALNYGTQGIEFRKSFVESSAEGVDLYQGFGLSFMKFYSPSIVFADGSVKINPGDWVYYQGPGYFSDDTWTCDGQLTNQFAKAQVDAVLDVSGNWANGTAEGRLLLKNNTLTKLPDDGCACSPDTYFEEGASIYNMEGNVIAAASVVDIPSGGFNDYIPDSLKPPGMGSWFHGNVNYTSLAEIEAMDSLGDNEGERLLLVLWQQRVNEGVEERRWLAYKDMTHDAYIQGKQYDQDGRIFHDYTGLVLRILESGSGTDKANEIEVLYSDGDGSASGRTKTRKPYDYGDERMGYLPCFIKADDPTSAGKPLWPPQDLNLWETDHDYLTHLETPEGESQALSFCWDGLICDSGSIESWDGMGQAVFKLEDDGRIVISDFTTPDSGSYYKKEFALSGHFNASREIVYDDPEAPEPASLNYFDTAVRFIIQGPSTSGFLTANQN